MFVYGMKFWSWRILGGDREVIEAELKRAGLEYTVGLNIEVDISVLDAYPTKEWYCERLIDFLLDLEGWPDL